MGKFLAMVVAPVVAFVAFWGVLIWVVAHFIAKLW